MHMEKENAQNLLKENRIEEAISLLDTLIGQHPEDDELYYLKGNTCRKKADWQGALQNYLEAMQRNEHSPAREAHRMLMEILEFYNKDMYNH